MGTASVASDLKRLTVTTTASVTQIVLRHPPLNVIDLAMMDELALALAEAEAQSDVGVVVVSGAGETFSAGVDVAAHTPGRVEAMLAKFHAVIRMLVASKKVTIAVVRGHSLGGGAELAMVCDLVYTADSAQWGFPEIKVGCYPPVACAALAALVGQKRAAEMILTGRTISGREAAEIGLANWAGPEGEIGTAVEECVARLGKLSPAALGAAKKASYGWDSVHFDKGLTRAEKVYLEELVPTADMREGINAFMEKREPKWIGK